MCTVLNTLFNNYNWKMLYNLVIPIVLNFDNSYMYLMTLN